MAQLFEFIGNHPLLVGTFVALLGLFISNEMRRGGRSVSAQQLVNLVNNSDAVVVDVRDSKEFSDLHQGCVVRITSGATDFHRSVEASSEA